MATPFEVPLSPTPQTFLLPLAGVTYRMTVRWNVPALCWQLDIADDQDRPILSSIPIVTGLDLLAQYRYLGIKGRLVVQTDYDLYAVPTFENLGIAGHLYFLPDE